MTAEVRTTAEALENAAMARAGVIRVAVSNKRAGDGAHRIYVEFAGRAVEPFRAGMEEVLGAHGPDDSAWRGEVSRGAPFRLEGAIIRLSGTPIDPAGSRVATPRPMLYRLWRPRRRATNKTSGRTT